jgi:hypothetical protein
MRRRRRASLLRQRDYLRSVTFAAHPYAAILPESTEGAVVYCDPPYAGTTDYPGAPPYDPAPFWRWAGECADAGARVFVSEHAAPEGWRTVSARTVPSYLARSKRTGGKGAPTRTDKLFTREPREAPLTHYPALRPTPDGRTP